MDHNTKFMTYHRRADRNPYAYSVRDENRKPVDSGVDNLILLCYCIFLMYILFC